MTREETIERMQAYKKYLTSGNPIWNVEEVAEAFDVVIRLLEQEPCVDVLNKIRAEIEAQRKKVSKKHSDDEALNSYYFGLNDGLKDARDIIDKYNAESENK